MTKQNVLYFWQSATGIQLSIFLVTSCQPADLQISNLCFPIAYWRFILKNTAVRFCDFEVCESFALII